MHMKLRALTTLIAMIIPAPSIAQARYSLYQTAGSRSLQATEKKGIRAVDFYNFTFRAYQYPDGTKSLTLHNGSDGRALPDDQYTASLASIRYLDLRGNGHEDAVITIRMESSGSMAYADDYFVFTSQGGTLQQIFHESRETPKPVRIVGRSLVIDAPFWGKGDPHCCPHFMETSVYRWRGSGMFRVSRRLTPQH